MSDEKTLEENVSALTVRVDKRMNEMEQKLNTMTKFESHFRDSSDHYKNVHIPLSNRIDTLERDFSRLELDEKAKLVQDIYNMFIDGSILRAVPIIIEIEKEISELRTSSVSHTEDIDGVRRHMSKLEQKVANPEWLDVLILELIKPTRETLQDFLEKMIGWQKEKQTDYDKKFFANSLRYTLKRLEP